ncbi:MULTISPECIES: DUF2987 domain-containing protein [Pseudomonadati]|uniref:DUF2987 domain-containing protein n=1 Tax=Shewanella aestuarii TaxID=1028752 RepID=A0ABT0KYI4_9GAMM|nr:DUF2987 domain-containing protein [Shewanella aestuarii]MCL1116056.1 DUF2987 domain-containing protein [Shewanella aestuarii]GGN70215.1 hypothetical protein GCM10009193_04930 [Shewanella aestuarii]
MLLHKSVVLGLTLLVFTSFNATSDTVSLEYSGFYNPLKRVNKASYPYVELVFSVPKSENCTILSGNITTESQSFPLTYTHEQRIFMPFDDDLKSNRGLVNIEVQGDANQCGIAMQVRARETLTRYTSKELQLVLDDMNGLLDTLQGFPMKYFRKPLTGLTFEFSGDMPLTLTMNGESRAIQSRFTISAEEIGMLTELSFSHKPSVLSPWVN